MKELVKLSSVPSGVPSGSPETSPTLMARLRAWYSEGGERFVQLYGPLVYSWCRRAGLTAEDASDVSHDVFATIATKLRDIASRRLVTVPSMQLHSNRQMIYRNDST